MDEDQGWRLGDEWVTRVRGRASAVTDSWRLPGGGEAVCDWAGQAGLCTQRPVLSMGHQLQGRAVTAEGRGGTIASPWPPIRLPSLLSAGLCGSPCTRSEWWYLKGLSRCTWCRERRAVMTPARRPETVQLSHLGGQLWLVALALWCQWVWPDRGDKRKWLQVFQVLGTRWWCWYRFWEWTQSPGLGHRLCRATVSRASLPEMNLPDDS